MNPRVSIKSSARDVLADHLARNRISEAQYRAGQEFRKHFDAAKKGQLIANGAIGTINGQSAAGKWLTKAYRELGADGSAIVHDTLIHGLSAKEIAELRGQTGPQSEKFYRMRLKECLSTLATVYGFAGEQKENRIGGCDGEHEQGQTRHGRPL